MKNILSIAIILGLANFAFSQNFGIDQPSPLVKLHVNGNAFFDLPSGGGALENSLTIKKTGLGQINFGSYPGAWTPALQIQSNDNSRYLWMSPLTAGGNARLVSIGSDFDIMPGNTAAATFYTTGSVRVRGDLFADNNYGQGLVGVYASTRYQNVFAMDPAYRLAADGTSTGNLYGLAWTHSNVGGQSISGLGHQLLAMSNGGTTAAMGNGFWSSYGADLGSNGTYNQFRTWTHFTGYHGIYSGLNGAHFYPNPSSYGSWQVLGERNGWFGLEFGNTPGGNLSLMMSHTSYGLGSQLTGVHNNSWGWLWYNQHRTFVAGGYSTFSTRNIKKDIRKLNDADYQSVLAFVGDLDLNYYRYKDPLNGKEIQIGFIAEETPTAITDGGNKTINNSQLTFLYTGAIKALNRKVEDIEKQSRNISDFGVDAISSGSLLVTFSEEFKSQLNGTRPVVTVTPSQLGVSMSVSKISQDGFIVEVAPQNQVVTFNWIAMAKTKVETQKENTQISQQFASFLESAKTEKVPIQAPELKLVPEGTYITPAHNPNPVKEEPAPAADERTEKK